MAHYILDKAYKVAEAAGVEAYRAVAYGTSAGECMYPAATNADSILGVTTHSQSLQNQNVSVRKAGIARVTAAGAIAIGNAVRVAGTGGKVEAITIDASGIAHCLGFAETAAVANGDIIEVFISIHQRTVPTS